MWISAGTLAVALALVAVFFYMDRQRRLEDAAFRSQLENTLRLIAGYADDEELYRDVIRSIEDFESFESDSDAALQDYLVREMDRQDRRIQGVESRLGTVVSANTRLERSLEVLGDRIGLLETATASSTMSLADEYVRAAEDAFNSGNYEGAAEHYAKAWEIDDRSAGHPLGYARSLNMASPPFRDTAEIDRAVMVVLGSEPENAEALKLGFDVAMEVDNTVKALELGTVLYSLDTRDITLAYTLGRLYIQEQRFAEAVPFLKTAADGRPEDPAAPTFLGTALTETGGYLEAEDSFRLALERSSGYAAAWDGLGRLAFLQEDYAEAVGHWAHVVEYRATPKAYRNLGDACSAAGRRSRAIRSWKTALSTTVMHSERDEIFVAEIYVRLANEYLDAGSWDTALEYALMGLDIRESSQLLLAQGMAMDGLEDNGSRRIYRRLLRDFPDSPEADLARERMGVET